MLTINFTFLSSKLLFYMTKKKLILLHFSNHYYGGRKRGDDYRSNNPNYRPSINNYSNQSHSVVGAYSSAAGHIPHPQHSHYQTYSHQRHQYQHQPYQSSLLDTVSTANSQSHHYSSNSHHHSSDSSKRQSKHRSPCKRFLFIVADCF
jgi:hypothetical protein